ncbi:MAG TPA: enoyl-CoA hydratase/isomerase family protein [Acidimicrobiia bacterium]|nr:enoyl-CoA hydratase/isomerase family protein [Acidimicrobiia bacterium]
MASPAGAAEVSAVLGTPVLVVDITGAAAAGPAGVAGAGVIGEAAARAAGLPAVVVAVCPEGLEGAPGWVAGLVDVVVADPGPVVATVEAAPQAAVTLALVLRATLSLGVAAGLAAESAAYSMLQAGPEFARWRATSAAGRPWTSHGYAKARSVGAIPTFRWQEAEKGPAVLVERVGSELRVTLSRPSRHNAVNTALRDELAEALIVACADPSIEQVVLGGAGPSFCSGGDLAEFGTLPDPATAHLVRLTRSPARLLAELGPRLEARLHGACIGAGIEMAAFAGRVVAHPDTVISLPEVGLGLIPGAGGTVSIPRRIGRHRTAELALCAAPIDAPTALRWGLVDAIRP